MTEAGALDPEAPSQASPAWPAWWWPGGVMLLVASLTPVVAYVSNLSFSVLVALGGLLCVGRLDRGRRPLFGLVYLVALACWALVSMAWSPATASLLESRPSLEKLTGLKMLFELALYGAFVSAALHLSRPDAGRASLTLAMGLCLLALLFFVEGLIGARIYLAMRSLVGQPTLPELAVRDVARVAYVLTLLFWPVSLRLSGGRLRWAPAGLAVSIVVGAGLLGVDAPIAALLVSSAVFFLVRRFGRRAIWLCLAGAVAYFALAPLVIYFLVPPDLSETVGADPARLSWAIRLDIWRFAADRILERPFFGWGLDASRTFSPDILLHTHNGALQIWLELGAVGAGLTALFWGWVFGRIDRLESRDRPLSAAAAAAATAFLTIGALSFGVWQEWWIALGAIAAAACIMGGGGRPLPPPPVTADAAA